MQTRPIKKIYTSIELSNLIHTYTSKHLIQSYQNAEQALQEAIQNNQHDYAFLCKLLMLDCRITLAIGNIEDYAAEFKELLAHQPARIDQSIAEHIPVAIKKLQTKLALLNDSLNEQVTHNYNQAFYLAKTLSDIDTSENPDFDFMDDDLDQAYLLTAKKLYHLENVADKITMLEAAHGNLEFAHAHLKHGLRSEANVTALQAQLLEYLADAHFDLQQSKSGSEHTDALKKALYAYQTSTALLTNSGLVTPLDVHFSVLNTLEQLALHDADHDREYIQQISDYIEHNNLKKIIKKLPQSQQEDAYERLHSHLEFCNQPTPQPTANIQAQPNVMEINPRCVAAPVVARTPKEPRGTKQSIQPSTPANSPAQAPMEMNPPPFEDSRLNEYEHYKTTILNHLPQLLFSRTPIQPDNNNSVEEQNLNEKAQRANNVFAKLLTVYQGYLGQNPRLLLSNVMVAMAAQHIKHSVPIDKKANDAFITGLLTAALAINPNCSFARDQLKTHMNGKSPNVHTCEHNDVYRYFAHEIKKYLEVLQTRHVALMPQMLLQHLTEFNSAKFQQPFHGNLALVSHLLDAKRLMKNLTPPSLAPTRSLRSP